MGKKKRELQQVNTLRPEDVIANKTFSQSLIDETKDSVSIFLVAQARQELERIVKMTEFLDKAQAMYQDKALEFMAMNNDPSALEYLPQMIENVSRSLERSYQLIKDVVNNEKIMNLSIVQNNISDSNIQVGGSNSVVADLSDPKSRERVRRAVAEILSSLPQEGEIIEGDGGE